MAEKIKLVADSIVDLSPELVERYNVEMHYLTINLGGKSYLDMKTITPEDCYAYYKQTGELPKTAASSPDEYREIFERWTNDGYSVICFAISSQMSAAYSSIKIASEEFDNVYCVDSCNLSTGVALQVIAAAELIEQGKTAPEIVEYLEKLVPRVDVSFILNTLHFLWKGGRCSGVAALGANVLKLRPCIEVKNGVMGVGKKYRGNFDAVLKYVEGRLEGQTDLDLSRIFITHSGEYTDEELQQVKAKVLSLQPFKEVFITQAAVTISCHCGPKTLGVLFVHNNPIEA